MFKPFLFTRFLQFKIFHRLEKSGKFISRKTSGLFRNIIVTYIFTRKLYLNKLHLSGLSI